MTDDKKVFDEVEMFDNMVFDKDPLERYNNIGKRGIRRLDGFEKASGRAIYTMDMQLPGMDGFTLAAMLKSDAQTRVIPVIAVTAYAMMGDAERIKAAGCDEYLGKPIDDAELIEVIQRCLGKCRPPLQD